MPPIEAGEHHYHQQQQQLRRPPKPGHVAGGGGAPPVAAEQEHLACPRCDSTNTKFCYYNNYNFSQPRHFCKSCRRYWTHGGTLRDIPVGGGTRKNAKRSRLSSPPSASPFPSPSLLLSADKMGPPPPPPPPSFTSLLSAGPPGGPGFLALGGLGLGLEDLGFGIGRGVWGFHGGGDVVSGGAGGVRGIGAAWQHENGVGVGGGGQYHHHHHHLHGGLVASAAAAGDYCSWAEPAVMSTPTATAFK